MAVHEYYMKRAIELAKNGWGMTNPNPLVGAVLIRNDRVIGEGWHRRCGAPHAEIEAIRNATEAVAGATMYVNLEPCSHTGRTPPCVRAILEHKISSVFIAASDPNPLVGGRGIRMLRDGGVHVETGIMETEAKQLNDIFDHFITCKKPYIVLKTAMTLDGKIATRTGDSRWVSGSASRKQVHKLRARMAAVCVGSRTVLADDPRLDVRLAGYEGTNPLRIVIDSRGITNPASRVYAGDGLALLATTSALSQEKEQAFLDRGVRIERLDGTDGKVDLASLVGLLYDLGIDSCLVEGGGNLSAAWLEAGLVDKVSMFIAPKMIGGRGAVTPVEGLGLPLMSDAIGLKNIQITRLDDDLLVEGEV